MPGLQGLKLGLLRGGAGRAKPGRAQGRPRALLQLPPIVVGASGTDRAVVGRDVLAAQPHLEAAFCFLLALPSWAGRAARQAMGWGIPSFTSLLGCCGARRDLRWSKVLAWPSWGAGFLMETLCAQLPPEAREALGALPDGPAV